jgi:hypothetical protein
MPDIADKDPKGQFRQECQQVISSDFNRKAEFSICYADNSTGKRVFQLTQSGLR